MTMIVHFETYEVIKETNAFIEKILDDCVFIMVLKCIFFNLKTVTKLVCRCCHKSNEECNSIIKEYKMCLQHIDEIEDYIIIC